LLQSEHSDIISCMINKSPEVILFATQPKYKTIRPGTILPVQTQAVLHIPNRSVDGGQIGNPFVYINTVGENVLVQGERVEIRGEIDPVSIYQAMLLTHAAAGSVDTFKLPSMKPDMAYAQFLRSSVGTVLPVGTVMQSVENLQGKRQEHWFIALISKLLRKERRPKDRPLINELLDTGYFTEEDLQNLVKQNPPKEDLRRAIRNLHQHGVPVKGGLFLYAASYLPEIQPRPRPLLHIPSPQS